jgi:hypothetical protein
MKRFLVFQFHAYYPEGGWNDLTDVYDDFDTARKLVEADARNGQVIDLQGECFFTKTVLDSGIYVGYGNSLYAAKRVMHETLVHKNPEDGKWYFWIETWEKREGPFESYEEANAEYSKRTPS